MLSLQREFPWQTGDLRYIQKKLMSAETFFEGQLKNTNNKRQLAVLSDNCGTISSYTNVDQYL